MLRIIGSLLLIAGSIGFGYCVQDIRKRRIAEMKQFIYLFRLLKSEIMYRREPLLSGCRHAGDKLTEELKQHRDAFSIYASHILQMFLKHA